MSAKSKYLVYYVYTGTDGDAAVAIALGYLLQELGHEVVMFADESTCATVTGAKMKQVIDIAVNFAEKFAGSPDVQSSNNPVKTLLGVPKVVQEIIQPYASVVWAECAQRRPDVIITNLPATFVLHPLFVMLKEQGIPVIRNDTYVWTDRRAGGIGIPPMALGANIGKWLPKSTYKLQHWSLDSFTFALLGWLSIYNVWKAIGRTSFQGHHKDEKTDLLRIVNSPRLLLPIEAQHADIKGLRFVDPMLPPYWGDDKDELHPDLREFINQYPNTPIWSAGMGSMPDKPKGEGKNRELDAAELTKLLIDVFQDLGWPLILLTGKGGLKYDGNTNLKGIFCTQTANHELLFNHVTGHVFHGGLGTMYRLMMKGKTGVALPHTIDQEYYAGMIEEDLGTLAKLSLRSVTHESLKNAVVRLSQPSLLGKAKETSTHIHDASAETASMVVQYLDEYYQK